MAKKYEELTFSDDFMFCKVLQNNQDLCCELLELILGRKVTGLAGPDIQKSIEITPDAKGVRFDVYLDDDEKNVYDIEMQTTKKRHLPKRMRYYQGMLDLNLLQRGSDYTELNRSYIIFICLENPYPDVGLHKYTFCNICRENNNIEMGDEATKIVLSAAGTANDVSTEMQAFLLYLQGKGPQSDFTDKIDAAVEKAREHREWRREYMTLLEKLEDAREEGRLEGRIEGRTEGMVKTIISLLEDGKITMSEAAGYTGIPEEILQKEIKAVENMGSSTITVWEPDTPRKP